MKKIVFSLIFLSLCSCTSNTIFKAPEDLIPKDTMSLLIEDMMIATAAKYTKNINSDKNINYMPLVYNQYKIDSARFKKSNLYYTSNIDLYQEIIKDAKESLDRKKEFYKKIKKLNDSLLSDSIKQVKKLKLDTIARDSIAKELGKIKLEKIKNLEEQMENSY